MYFDENEEIANDVSNEETVETTETEEVVTENEEQPEIEDVTPHRRRKKKKKRTGLKIILILLLLIVIGLAGVYVYYTSSLKPISKEDKQIEIIIPKGATAASIAKILEENGVIRSKLVFQVFVKQKGYNNMQAGTYQLSTNMSIEEIFEALNQGSGYNPDMLNITFIEGKNMRWIADKIASNTNHTTDEVFACLENKQYINSLIQKYWFLTSDIQNSSIYYPLEGYLFPDTYSFQNKDVSIETIFETMLDQTEKKLEPYKSEIQKSNYSVHQLLTLASVVESEGAKKDSRSLIASVFYNRLKANMPLGSDVTTYYAIQVDMSERDLYKTEINSYNPYNTRGPNMNGKLPVGPICSPSIESIKAAIEPENSNYLYFVADKNGNVYFTKTNAEHNQKVQELKSQGLWYDYNK